MSGYNSCIFAYGQTGSGKTYTMLGPGTDSFHGSTHANEVRLIGALAPIVVCGLAEHWACLHNLSMCCRSGV